MFFVENNVLCINIKKDYKYELGFNKTMDFLEITGIETEKSVDFEVIRPSIDGLIERFEEVKDYLPAIMKKRGEKMCLEPTNVRAVMSFLRSCAKKADYTLLVQKRTLRRENQPTTSYCLYRLVAYPEFSQI